MSVVGIAVDSCESKCCDRGRAASCAAGLVGCRASLNVALEVFALTCNEIGLSPSLGQMNREEDGERMRLSWR
jgi:hypothetical protein